MTVHVQRDPKVKPSAETAHVVIYVYEVWGLRFGIARVQLRSREVPGAWLTVEPLAAVAKVIATRNLSQALLSKAEELTSSI